VSSSLYASLCPSLCMSLLPTKYPSLSSSLPSSSNELEDDITDISPQALERNSSALVGSNSTEALCCVDISAKSWAFDVAETTDSKPGHQSQQFGQEISRYEDLPDPAIVEPDRRLQPRAIMLDTFAVVNAEETTKTTCRL